ncbi:hypothetical protein MUN81_00240 [Hymenobacter sp. 5317J-9]|uniref:hypothetical protein n=1 Tax=Hymenobacter sp. 5317J-9 TaxID=2932250 RepID=UPI001FD6FBE3|nr:hypothetical protein [Hymenobacter sp. 5317J-9]UOQ97944.1 hypothetical protein MUN81_00240 [Hymenobacter sp. 5317J-9]
MCSWLTVGQSSAQTQSAVAGGPGPVINCTPTVKASRTDICQGGSAVLTPTIPCAATTYTYAWSPNQNLSATTGAQVVVSPLATTTYTVTATPASGAPVSMSVTVVVKTNCCQYSYSPAPPIVELGPYYTADFTQPQYGYGDPFRYDFSSTPPTPRAPGTYFHVARGTLTLNNNEFHLPTGGVLLMEAGADVVLDDARLYLEGGTITAACDDMWGGLVHPGNGHGVYANPWARSRRALCTARTGWTTPATRWPRPTPRTCSSTAWSFCTTTEAWA